MNIDSLYSYQRVACMISVTLMMILTTSCSSDPDPQSPPQVNNISPSSGPVNTSVTISGTNFSPVLAENKVNFDGIAALVTTATATQLTATVPLFAESGPVSVIVKGLAAVNQPIFTVEAIPEVSIISPSIGTINTSVIITGTNFSIILAENKVTFNGKDAVVTLATATQLTTTVPLLAETGPVIVTVKGKTATNQPIFTVQQIDKIRLAISTSLAAYDAAADNTWIPITADEYNNLLTEVSGSDKYASPEIFMNTGATAGWEPDYTTGGNDNALKVPASNYIIAWSVRTGTGISSSFGSKLKISSSQKAGYVDYGPSLPNISNIQANTRVYFVLKKPTITTPDSPSYTAVYNASKEFLGTTYGMDAGPEFYVAGDSSNPSTPQETDSYSQVISTATLQW